LSVSIGTAMNIRVVYNGRRTYIKKYILKKSMSTVKNLVKQLFNKKSFRLKTERTDSF